MSEPVMLTETERATLHGLVAARNAVSDQIEAYLSGTVCARLGIHRNRLRQASTETGVVTLATDAPKAEPAAPLPEKAPS